MKTGSLQIGQRFSFPVNKEELTTLELLTDAIGRTKLGNSEILIKR
jgi:hypothetical protein